MTSYTREKERQKAAKPSIPSNSWGFNLNLQDAEGTYKTYLGGGALPPDGFTNPADPRVQEELTDHFLLASFWCDVPNTCTNTHTRCLPSSLVGISPQLSGVSLGSGIIWVRMSLDARSVFDFIALYLHFVATSGLFNALFHLPVAGRRWWPVQRWFAPWCA